MLLNAMQKYRFFFKSPTFCLKFCKLHLKATNCCVFVVRIFVLDYCLNKKSLTKNFDLIKMSLTL